MSAEIDLPIREVTNHACSLCIALEILLLQCHGPNKSPLGTPEESFSLFTPNGNLVGKTEGNLTLLTQWAFPTTQRTRCQKKAQVKVERSRVETEMCSPSFIHEDWACLALVSNSSHFSNFSIDNKFPTHGLFMSLVNIHPLVK